MEQTVGPVLKHAAQSNAVETLLSHSLDAIRRRAYDRWVQFVRKGKGADDGLHVVEAKGPLAPFAGPNVVFIAYIYRVSSKGQQLPRVLIAQDRLGLRRHISCHPLLRHPARLAVRAVAPSLSTRW